MLPLLFSNPIILAFGLIAGIFLGFLLQKSRLAHFDTIINQFLLQDFTFIKIMLIAVIFGASLIHVINYVDLPVIFHIKEFSIFALVIGATLVGIGVAILGYTPATSIAAAGQGSRDAWWGILGMLFGAALYAESDAWLKKSIHKVWYIKEHSLYDLLGETPWIIILMLAVTIVVLAKRK